MTTTVLSTAVVICLAIGATWFDVRERRIPNALTLTALIAAIVLRVPEGNVAIAAGFMGAAICFGLALVLFLLGALGGGDVKMLTAAGALLGPSRLGTALLVTACVGGLMGISQIFFRRRWTETMANIHTILATFGRRSLNGWKGAGEGAALTLNSPDAMSVPYGVAIAAGALVGWFLPLL